MNHGLARRALERPGRRKAPRINRGVFVGQKVGTAQAASRSSVDALSQVGVGRFAASPSATMSNAEPPSQTPPMIYKIVMPPGVASTVPRARAPGLPP
jgi:hypothetical protein